MQKQEMRTASSILLQLALIGHNQGLNMVFISITISLEIHYMLPNKYAK